MNEIKIIESDKIDIKQYQEDIKQAYQDGYKKAAYRYFLYGIIITLLMYYLSK